MAFRHDYVVRYSECDRQGVVYNSHYQMFMDDAVDVWLREFDPAFEQRGWELMLKKTEIVWHAGASLNETFTVEARVSRWGNTSFDVSFTGHVGELHCIDGAMTYIVVDTRAHRPVPIPVELRAHLE